MVNPETFQTNKRVAEDEAPPTSQTGTSQDSPGADDELKQLQELLLGDSLNGMAQNVDAEAVAEVLPQAIVKARDQQEFLTHAAVFTVESAIRTSVNQDVNILSEALFPVIGPAARKSVSTAMDNLVQSFDRALEHSLSPQSFKWRLEAWQTGKTFAEVVLLRTLVYQVEQVFLIHKETGLVLQHVVVEEVNARDPDMVSAMLTALQDFVKDSFSVASGDGLDTLELGDFNLWLEAGPKAVLACVIRGTAPHELRETMCESLEKVHSFFGPQLTAFDGDQTAFVSSRPYLEECLQAQFKSEQADDAPSPKKLHARTWVVLGVIALGLFAKVALDYQVQRRWLSYVEEVDKQPGIVVIHAKRKGGKFHLEGLRDPLATDPDRLLQKTKLKPDSVQMVWEPYVSNAPDFIEARTYALLEPPPNVDLRVDRQSQVLHLAGEAPEQWIRQARRLSQRLGLSGLDDSRLESTERKQLQELKKRIESQQLDFVPQGTQLQASGRDTLEQQARDLHQLIEIGRLLETNVQIILTGSSDRGVPAWKSLGKARSERTRHDLIHQGIRPALMIVQASPEDKSSESPGRSAVKFTVQVRN